MGTPALLRLAIHDGGACFKAVSWEIVEHGSWLLLCATRESGKMHSIAGRAAFLGVNRYLADFIVARVECVMRAQRLAVKEE